MGRSGGRKQLTGWRKAGRITLWTILTVIVLFGLFVALVYNPVILFPYEATHQNFTVHMREEIPTEIIGILEIASQRISNSEINDPNLHHQVFIINSFALRRFLLWRNPGFGCNMPNGVTYIVMADVVKDKAYSEKDGLKDTWFIRTMSETIAHEVTHRLMRDNLGYWPERKLPVWVREGYCEYISQGCAVDQGYALKLVKARQGYNMRGVKYFWGRLMVGYLIEVQGISFDGLIEFEHSFSEVQSQMLTELNGERGDEFLSSIGIEGA